MTIDSFMWFDQSIFSVCVFALLCLALRWTRFHSSNIFSKQNRHGKLEHGRNSFDVLKSVDCLMMTSQYWLRLSCLVSFSGSLAFELVLKTRCDIKLIYTKWIQLITAFNIKWRSLAKKGDDFTLIAIYTVWVYTLRWRCLRTFDSLKVKSTIDKTFINLINPCFMWKHDIHLFIDCFDANYGIVNIRMRCLWSWGQCNLILIVCAIWYLVNKCNFLFCNKTKRCP